MRGLLNDEGREQSCDKTSPPSDISSNSKERLDTRSLSRLRDMSSRGPTKDVEEEDPQALSWFGGKAFWQKVHFVLKGRPKSTLKAS